jgi:hypothetical protein
MPHLQSAGHARSPPFWAQTFPFRTAHSTVKHDQASALDIVPSQCPVSPMVREPSLLLNQDLPQRMAGQTAGLPHCNGAPFSSSTKQAHLCNTPPPPYATPQHPAPSPHRARDGATAQHSALNRWPEHKPPRRYMLGQLQSRNSVTCGGWATVTRRVCRAAVARHGVIPASHRQSALTRR